MTGETAVDSLSWAPKKAAFIRRALIVGCATFAVLVLFGAGLSRYFNAPIFWAFPAALVLTLGFIFDDILRWRTEQYDRWQISDGYLIHEGEDGGARIPLTEIDRAFRRLDSDVVVQLISRQRIVLRYLPFPSETAAQINAAKPA